MLTSFKYASPIAKDVELMERFLGKFIGIRGLLQISESRPVRCVSSRVRGGGEDRLPTISSIPKAPNGLVGIGSIHHVALVVENERDQLSTNTFKSPLHNGDSLKSGRRRRLLRELSQETDSFPIDVTPGMVAGLVEVINLFKGKVDLPLLSRELGMELGSLLRVIEAAERLGFVKVENGDVVITQTGQMFSRRVSSSKLKTLRERVAEIEPFKSIIGVVGKEAGGISVEEINEKLRLCEQDEEQLDRLRSFIIDWLVTTGWLGYDGEARKFKLMAKRQPKTQQR